MTLYCHEAKKPFVSYFCVEPCTVEKAKFVVSGRDIILRDLITEVSMYRGLQKTEGETGKPRPPFQSMINFAQQYSTDGEVEK